MVLVGNKVDMEAQREVSFEEASRFADENGLMFAESSAKTGLNVEEAFLQTAKSIFDKIQNGVLDPNSVESGIQFGQVSTFTNQLANSEKRNSCQC
eukprot:NODE_4799_length_626_cov_130.383016_g4006_i1.p1 GENE.NODE_4799_length_626_cov_130.383016_g4006_i1~~NODE_4799_length_626_cov_130.383016_g4006_i1.p1  ORF type:complete len:96 (-),score=22.20 NODE_4799_length_626_cov_130.383016_g4006_i1:71-358(-)